MSNASRADETYPTDEELKTIEEWPIGDPWGLIEYLEKVWHYDDCVRLSDWIDGDCHRYKKLELVTLGWSGNESLIAALNKSTFWMAYWESSHRGGLYVFHVRELSKRDEKPWKG